MPYNPVILIRPPNNDCKAFHELLYTNLMDIGYSTNTRDKRHLDANDSMQFNSKDDDFSKKDHNIGFFLKEYKNFRNKTSTVLAK